MYHQNINENVWRLKILLDDERLLEKDMSDDRFGNKKIKMDRSGKKYKNASRLR